MDLPSNEFSKTPRHYYCPITDQDILEAPLKEFSGLAPFNKTKFDFKRSLDKAISGSFKFIFLPYNSYLHRQLFNFVIMAEERGLDIIWQVHASQLDEERIFKMIESKAKFIEIVLHKYDLSLERKILELKEKGIEVSFSCHINSYKNLSNFIEQINPQVCKHLQLIYAFCESNSRERIVADLKELKQSKGIAFTAAVGRSVYSSQVPNNLEIERVASPMFDSRDKLASIKVSVVIPSYNGGDSILPCLRHLSRQDLNKKEYEVIIVDDGSSDETYNKVKDFCLATKGIAFQICYIYFPRVLPRKMGDHRFRAGSARNLGVKFARGKQLAFLDSDMIVPQNYLSDIIEKLNSWDVVQHPRYHLRVKSCKEGLKYESLKQSVDTYIRHNKYWEDFYCKASKWNDLNDSWRYISSNSLCLSRSLFDSAGGFRNAYTSYGFEDTELGYQLYRRGAQFYLNNNVTYHFSPKKHKTEFFGHQSIKKELLGRSARVFFHNTLYWDESGVLGTYL